MPLCTLEIPHEQWTNMDPAERGMTAVSACNNALDQVLEGLKIPNREDREIRILLGQLPSSRMSISFTVGTNEYPDFPGRETFFPSAEEIHAVGLAVQAQAGNTILDVAETRMEWWRDTTFIIVDRSKEAAEIIVPPELENRNEIGRRIGEPKVTLVIPGEVIGAGSHPTKEGEGPGELEAYRGVGREIYRMLAETLGLPEENGGQIELLVAEDCDTRFSLEFDCQPEADFLISESVRQFAAKKVEHFLNTNSLTHEGSAEVWIRQGKPTIDVIPETVLGNTGFGR